MSNTAAHLVDRVLPSVPVRSGGDGGRARYAAR